MKRQATKPTAQKSQEPRQEANLEEQALESTKESDQTSLQKADSSSDSSELAQEAAPSTPATDSSADSSAAQSDSAVNPKEPQTEKESDTAPSTAQDSSTAPSTQEETPKESLDSKIAEGESGAFSRNIGLRRAVSLVLQSEQGDKTSGLLKDFSSKTKSPYNLICVIISWRTYLAW